MTHFRHVAIAAAMLAGVGSASAQTTVITREPLEPRTIVTTQPLALTPVQRRTIYRTIVRELVETAPPAVRSYRYMRVNNHVVLVDPATSEVVADFVD